MSHLPALPSSPGTLEGMDWIGIGIVVVLGVAVILYGWLWDRTTNRRRDQALDSPPQRSIPGLASDAESPAYVLAKDLTPHTDADAEAVAALRARLETAPMMLFGHGRGAFATVGPELAVVTSPVILVVDGEVTSMRELLPAVEQAHLAKTGLIVAAARISDEVYQTLEANALAHTLTCAAVVIPAKLERARLAEMSGATMVPLGDLRMGWLPTESLGHCGTWVSEPQRLWLLDDEIPTESSTDAGDDFLSPNSGTSTA